MTSAGFLERMARASRERVAAAAAREPEGRLLQRARTRPAPPPLRLEGFDVIAELKLRSPAAGPLGRAGLDCGAQVAAYARGGAAAVSVLTEPDAFEGSLAHLEKAAERLAPLGCPIMRKDFLTEPYQVIEARAAGASGVLVIVTMLGDGEARALLDCARELGLFVLLEAFDREDLERICALAPREPDAVALAGLNCRNLETLEVDFERFAALAGSLPADLPAVAESGVDSARAIETVAALGYRAALVGSALMQCADAGARLAGFVAAGRAAVGRDRECL